MSERSVDASVVQEVGRQIDDVARRLDEGEVLEIYFPNNVDRLDVPHGLGAIPVGFHVLVQWGGLVEAVDVQLWTPEIAYLRATCGGTRARVVFVSADAVRRLTDTTNYRPDDACDGDGGSDLGSFEFGVTKDLGGSRVFDYGRQADGTYDIPEWRPVTIDWDLLDPADTVQARVWCQIDAPATQVPRITDLGNGILASGSSSGDTTFTEQIIPIPRPALGGIQVIKLRGSLTGATLLRAWMFGVVEVIPTAGLVSVFHNLGGARELDYGHQVDATYDVPEWRPVRLDWDDIDMAAIVRARVWCKNGPGVSQQPLITNLADVVVATGAVSTDADFTEQLISIPRVAGAAYYKLRAAITGAALERVWTFGTIEIIQPAGTGPSGPPGAPGADGADGADGVDGVVSLARLFHLMGA